VSPFPEKIVVGYDDSDPSKQALERVADVAGDGATLTLVTSAEPLFSEPWAAQIDPGEAERRDQALSNGRQFLAQRGIEAITIPAVGDPAEAILEAAREADADLVVVGNSGRGFVARLTLGSVSTKVAPSEANQSKRLISRDYEMGRAGLEPATLGLKVPCSTS
jgi:nucleotide-binding universal stress UspA family protein